MLGNSVAGCGRLCEGRRASGRPAWPAPLLIYLLAGQAGAPDCCDRGRGQVDDEGVESRPLVVADQTSEGVDPSGFGRRHFGRRPYGLWIRPECRPAPG